MTDRERPSGPTPVRLRCEASIDPLGIAVPAPRLSWIVQSDRRGAAQSAYQVLAASSPARLREGQADLWDSGKVSSDETLAIEYAGRPLTPSQRCWWCVRVWDESDSASQWSAPAVFGAGLRTPDWTAEWIGFDHTRAVELPTAPFDGAMWIWLGSDQAASGSGVFVGMLELPSDVEIEHAEIALAVAGKHRLYWSREQFSLGDDDPEPWRRPYMRDMTERLHPGTNRFLLWAEQIGQEPAGVLFKATVRAAGGRVYSMVSDGAWRATDHVADNWYEGQGIEEWRLCAEVARYGEQPWGKLRGAKNYLPPAAYLRGGFDVVRPVRQATLFATALGSFEARLNGKCVNDTYFDPGWADYRKRLYYRAYDVTSALHEGENALGAILADGWYSGYVGWYHRRDTYGKHPRFRAQLHIEYADGTSQVVSTDATWQATIGPIKEADMLMGELYDARDEIEGWDRPGFDASSWDPVDTGTSLQPEIQPHPAPPVIALANEQFVPRTIAEPRPNTYIFDLGQNFAGIARLTVRGAKSGQRITLRFGERLNADGTLYTRNLRTARATDIYICRGDAEETWSPRFTFHGFQYVELTGVSSPPDRETIVGIPLSTDTPRCGDFDCSDELVNRLASNIYWGQRSNFIEIPSDCPQRDERLGWCDGAHVFVHAAALRADVQSFYNKWMVDLEDAQYPDGLFPWVAPLVVTTAETSGELWAGSSPGWADAGVICPWSIYEIYGDRRQLAAHYPAMVRQVEWYRRTSRTNLLPPERHRCLGDWLNFDDETPLDVFRTAFFAYSTGLVARAARVLGNSDDAAGYEELHRRIKVAFRRAYVQADGTIYGDTQACYAYALAFDLLDDAQAGMAAEHLIERLRRRDWSPSTGIEATLPLMLALARIGRNDVAYRLLHNERFPSWMFSIKNGATTIWERWNSWTPEEGFGDANMNSFNHFSLGAVYQWMVEQIGGIQSDGPAYKQFIIAPCPGGDLTSAAVSYESVRGRIATAWERTAHAIKLRVTVPANTRATIILPTDRAGLITEGGLPLESVTDLVLEPPAAGRVALRASSGTYNFVIATSEDRS